MTDAQGASGEGPTSTLRAAHPHIWVIDVRDPAFLALGERDLVTLGLVSKGDRERADAFSDPAEGVRLLARRAALRIVLGRYLSCMPADVRLVTAPGGKPMVLPTRASRVAASPAFSVGHSGDLYCIAVGMCRSVGCDIERVRTVPRARAIATRWFGAREAEVLDSVSEDELDTAFMELWTGKEALAKRHGAGLRLMKGQADEPEVRDELDVDRERRSGTLRSFPAGDGYVGAIASSEAITGVEVIRPKDDAWIT